MQKKRPKSKINTQIWPRKHKLLVESFQIQLKFDLFIIFLKTLGRPNASSYLPKHKISNHDVVAEINNNLELNEIEIIVSILKVILANNHTEKIM